jgi:hypothetical protein
MDAAGLRKMHEAAEKVTVSTQDDGWYDAWHFHVDWKGAGNGNPDVTRVVLECLRTAYTRIQTQIAGWKVPHQCWIIVNTTDSGQSAVFLHTPHPNPNGAPFPIATTHVDFTATRPFWIAEVFPEGQYRCGRTYDPEEHVECFWIL